MDGVKTDAGVACGMMTAIPLNTGKHVVELKYTPPGLIQGLIATLISLIFICLSYMFNKEFMDEQVNIRV